MNPKSVLLLVSPFVVCAAVNAQTGKVDEAVRSKMTEQHVAGTSVAVLRNGKVVLAKGYGMSNVEQSIRAAPETRYQIASTTKPFTATAIMMLVEGGQVALDEKAAKYLPK